MLTDEWWMLEWIIANCNSQLMMMMMMMMRIKLMKTMKPQLPYFKPFRRQTFLACNTWNHSMQINVILTSFNHVHNTWNTYRYISIIWAWYKCGTRLVQGSLYDTNPNNALLRGNPSKTTFATLENLVLIPPKMSGPIEWSLYYSLFKFAKLLWGFKKNNVFAEVFL